MPVIPVLRKALPFPATEDFTFKFDALGSGSQIVYNELEISLSSDTSNIIYQQKIQEFRYQHMIPANILINGNQYVAKIKIFDVNQNLLGESDPLFFYCFSYPLLNIPTIIDGEINNQTVTFTGEYSQAEGELLQSYIFYLYDNNKYLVAQSPEIYSDVISYEFSELENAKVYYIELKIVTVNEMEYSTGLIKFTPRYIAPRFISAIELENSPDDASIFVKCNVIRIVGVPEVEPVNYINDEMVDLTSNLVEFEQGFTLEGDFDLRLWVKSIVENEPFFTLKSRNDERLELVLKENKIYLQTYLDDDYMLQKIISDELMNLLDNILFICIKKINNLYDLYCEVVV